MNMIILLKINLNILNNLDKLINNEMKEDLDYECNIF